MKKIILSIAVLALALSSCEDFLTKEPPMDQSDELALSTFEGIDGATAGNYRAVISWYGASFPLTFDVMCGNGMVGPVNTGRMRQEAGLELLLRPARWVFGRAHIARYWAVIEHLARLLTKENSPATG